MARTLQFDRDDVRRLFELIANVQLQRTVQETVLAVVNGVVEGVGFQAAAMNLRQDDRYRVAAVAGDLPGLQNLVGMENDAAYFERQFAAAECWGDLFFLSHHAWGGLGLEYGWAYDGEALEHPDAWHPLDALYAPLRGSDGELVGVISVDLPRDRLRPDGLQCEMLEIFAELVSVAVERARLYEQVRSNETLFRTAFEGAANGMVLTPLRGGEIAGPSAFNDAVCQMLGYTQEQMAGFNLEELLHEDDPVATCPPEALRVLAGKPGITRETDRVVRTASGEPLWVAVRSSVSPGPDGRDYAVTSIMDVNERRADEEKLRRRARLDALTGALNRGQLDPVLASHAARAHRSGRPGAVMFCDLDHFKAINDSFGHRIGDLVLVEVAQRMRHELRSGDAIIRIGGDEFLLVVGDLTADDANRLAVRISEAVGTPMVLDSTTIQVRVSIGVASTDDVPSADDIDGLLKLADEAMYVRKRRLAAVPHPAHS